MGPKLTRAQWAQVAMTVLGIVLGNLLTEYVKTRWPKVEDESDPPPLLHRGPWPS